MEALSLGCTGVNLASAFQCLDLNFWDGVRSLENRSIGHEIY